MYFEIAVCQDHYRGIDREISTKDFPNVFRIFDDLFNHYLTYLSFEHQMKNDYSVDDEIVSFVSLLKKNSVDCEILLYNDIPMEEKGIAKFLGIDVIDGHIKSFIKRNRDFFKITNGFLNSNQLFYTIEDAQFCCNRLKDMNGMVVYDMILPMYVYLYLGA